MPRDWEVARSTNVRERSDQLNKLLAQIPADWQRLLGDEEQKPYWTELANFIDGLPDEPPSYPPPSLIFNAFRQTRCNDVKVVILGQDPYHNDGQAHGLSFSVPEGIALPPSLKNIFRELSTDLAKEAPASGDLRAWAQQGVLLLNTVLTVEAHQPHSHRNRGWEKFTDAVIQKLVQRSTPIAFVLWGRPAQTKRDLIPCPPHWVLEAPHPSPLSAHRGFFGSRPFSRINQWLVGQNRKPIEW